MGFTLFFGTRIHFLIFLLVLSSPCKFIQSPMDFGPLKLTGTTDTASLDFGRMSFRAPSAIFQPQSAQDISLLLSFIYTSSFSKLTVAAKGAGHSINGQAQALNGIVIEMDSLPSSIKIHKNEEKGSYVDVSGGTLWIELLEQTLKEGLAPRSWTDYLYLSVGGTLSNAGISGQTFKYGPQISNVLQLDVVTGTGELVTCSPSKSSELFYAALGGLGQFGIITKARIFLQESPKIISFYTSVFLTPRLYLRMKPVTENLRTLGGTANLIFDVIQYPFYIACVSAYYGTVSLGWHEFLNLYAPSDLFRSLNIDIPVRTCQVVSRISQNVLQNTLHVFSLFTV
ncbi:hypothetical protein MKW94_005163, partial [Papaver nudicaule]|nr:hypothetical protein [Papaver nudicaule]